MVDEFLGGNFTKSLDYYSYTQNSANGWLTAGDSNRTGINGNATDELISRQYIVDVGNYYILNDEKNTVGAPANQWSFRDNRNRSYMITACTMP
jgi:hypothetical protein